MTLERHFDAAFTARLATREKQIQQAYRPIIGIHKWFARRPGTVFRNLLLAEYNSDEPLDSSYWRAHRFEGVIADPFMGGGTTLFEADRLGFSVIGCDVNPMATWIVRQTLGPLDLDSFAQKTKELLAAVEAEIRELYQTACSLCGEIAEVKYFIWVKTQRCPNCKVRIDLFPGYLLAEAVRHPRNVIVCAGCGSLNEYVRVPTEQSPEKCDVCESQVRVEGPARRNSIVCHNCDSKFRYPPANPIEPPEHRLWAIEYHCRVCKKGHVGRLFKTPDKADLDRIAAASERLKNDQDLLLPAEDIPHGDETNRLHRWGYRRYRDMFNGRQLLSLGSLLTHIATVRDEAVRQALLTVFSDFLRYQNMLCRYDTYALKCQDIFSVHGFPVGLIQCENNVLGIERVGSGGFRHFVEKFIRAKSYCASPFEVDLDRGRRRIVPVVGEKIEARLVDRLPVSGSREAFVVTAPAATVDLPNNYLDGVFTDPPYFDNVQYAELIDFCYVWLRLGLQSESDFHPRSTRSSEELTGNATMGKDLEHFTEGLSEVFRQFAVSLKPGAPFVFTYHHNDSRAYVPIVVAVLDAGLNCAAVLPAPAEMAASLHIAGTGSSVLDSIFVCRVGAPAGAGDAGGALSRDIQTLRNAGLSLTEGDIRCLFAGHIAREAIVQLSAVGWAHGRPVPERMAVADAVLKRIAERTPVTMILERETAIGTPPV